MKKLHKDVWFFTQFFLLVFTCGVEKTCCTPLFSGRRVGNDLGSLIRQLESIPHMDQFARN